MSRTTQLLPAYQTPLYLAYDQLLGGELRDLILGWRKQEWSHDVITTALQVRGVRASKSTVGRWCMAIEREEAEKDALELASAAGGQA